MDNKYENLDPRDDIFDQKLVQEEIEESRDDMNDMLDALRKLNTALAQVEKSTSDLVEYGKTLLSEAKRANGFCRVHGCFGGGILYDEDGNLCEKHLDLRKPYRPKGLDSIFK